MPSQIKILRPVGNRINTTTNKTEITPFSSFHTCFYTSGTAALAAAILAASKLKSDIDKPEVIVPAYGCPDLISAVICAKATPILVDLEPDSPQMSFNQLHKSINNKTIAIIAVRFFGIADRNEELLKITNQHNLLLIEDSAQGFPTTDIDSYWNGDFVILSFGRGKPVNLLGGGAVLTKSLKLMKLLPSPPAISDSLFEKVKYKLKLFLYNQSIRPLAYGLITHIPGLHIGQTIYKPLNNIEGTHKHIQSLLISNLKSYQTRKTCQKEYKRILEACDKKKLIDLPSVLGHNMSQPLLRYPILIKDNSLRNKLYEKLKCYGASLMYKKPLNQIEGVDKHIKQQKKSYPNATRFSQQLLTLPTHEGVNGKTLKTIDRILKEV